MGVGDLKLALPIALLLSWPDTILSFSFAFIIGALIGLILIWKYKKTGKDALPFGPFMVLGLYVVIFYGESLARWYFGLVSV
jgi:leader peptidase (prepilin peptidase)/N-methyltransferase